MFIFKLCQICFDFIDVAVLASSPTEIHRFQSYGFWVASWESAIYDILKLIWYD